MIDIQECLKTVHANRELPRKNHDYEIDESETRRVRCAQCGSYLTTKDERIQVEGAVRHRCVNPHGLLFFIECYGHADGTCTSSEPETFWSWFSGFAWQTVECRGCGAHVGWFFSNTSLSFVGLIVERLLNDS